MGDTSARPLARISHRQSTTSPQSSALAVFRSVGLLDVLPRVRLRRPRSQALPGPALATPRYDGDEKCGLETKQNPEIEYGR